MNNCMMTDRPIEWRVEVVGGIWVLFFYNYDFFQVLSVGDLFCVASISALFTLESHPCSLTESEPAVLQTNKPLAYVLMLFAGVAKSLVSILRA